MGSNPTLSATYKPLIYVDFQRNSAWVCVDPKLRRFYGRIQRLARISDVSQTEFHGR